VPSFRPGRRSRLSADARFGGFEDGCGWTVAAVASAGLATTVVAAEFWPTSTVLGFEVARFNYSALERESGSFLLFSGENNLHLPPEALN